MRILFVICFFVLTTSLRPSPVLALRTPRRLLKRLDASARLSPDGCKIALDYLVEFDERGLTWALGPNAVNRVMSLCAANECSEDLFNRLTQHDLVDATSLQLIAASRLSRGSLLEAADATSDLMQHLESAGKTAPLKVAQQCRTVLDACQHAGIMHCAEAQWHALLARGVMPPLTPPPPPPPQLERTLAVLKPDATRAGHDSAIVQLIIEAGFEVVATRRWRMQPLEAAGFLRCSWGSAAGDRQRKFFTSMVDFYSSGESLALLLQREDAIAAWRHLLGETGDPAACREAAPASVRARFGTSKQANAGHGADSAAAARREVAYVFGSGWSEPGWAPLVLPGSTSTRRARAALRQSNIRVRHWDNVFLF